MQTKQRKRMNYEYIRETVRNNSMFGNLLQDIMLPIKPYKGIRKYLIKLPKSTTDAIFKATKLLILRSFAIPYF